MNLNVVLGVLFGTLVSWAVGGTALAAEPSFRGSIQSGFILLSEQRFDPSVQRMLAERSLDALPLYNGRLFYIVPSHVDRGEQQAQIRYLEHMLKREGATAAATTKPPSSSNPAVSGQQK